MLYEIFIKIAIFSRSYSKKNINGCVFEHNVFQLFAVLKLTEYYCGHVYLHVCAR